MPGVVDSKSDTRGTLASLPCALPTSPIPIDCDAQSVADSFATKLSALDETHFTQDAIWRDSFALTGTFRTFYSSKVTLLAWRKLCAARKVHSFIKSATPARVVRLPGGAAWLEATYDFCTSASPATECTIVLALTPGGNDSWKIWMFGTILQRLIGSPSPDVLQPETASDLQRHDSPTGISTTETTADGTASKPFGCVVVGAGQAGLAVAGRVKALGISYVVLDKTQRTGDSWKHRYESARLHTTRQYAHLPFGRTFPTGEYQEFLTKDDVAAGYQDWAIKYGMKIWHSTTLISGKWDSERQLWTLTIRSDDTERSIVTQSVVLATGGGGQKPSMPNLPGLQDYQGESMHSVNFKTAQPWKGGKGVVVGTANTGHDIAKDFYEADCSSTMIQRSATYIMPAEYYKDVLDRSYNDDVLTSTADMSASWAPLAVTRLVSMRVLNSRAEQDSERFDALERAGFLTQRYGDILHHIYERGGGHYMDVGASAMIADGKVRYPRRQHGECND